MNTECHEYCMIERPWTMERCVVGWGGNGEQAAEEGA